MPFELQPATIEDVPMLAIIQREAFADDAIVGHLFKDVPENIQQERDVNKISTFFEESDSNGVRYTKVVDRSTGNIVGFAKWIVPHALTAEEKADRAKGPRNKKSLPEGANAALFEDFFGQLDRKLNQWVDPERDIYLDILAIRPKYHRLGLGTQLLKAVLAVADAENWKTYIVASPMGLPLYLRRGWHRVDDRIEVDMKKYGGGSIVAEEILLREPGADP